jgi:hypothetical protein
VNEPDYGIPVPPRDAERRERDTRDYCLNARADSARRARANGDNATADYLETRMVLIETAEHRLAYRVDDLERRLRYAELSESDQ